MKPNAWKENLSPIKKVLILGGDNVGKKTWLNNFENGFQLSTNSTREMVSMRANLDSSKTKVLTRSKDTLYLNTTIFNWNSNIQDYLVPLLYKVDFIILMLDITNEKSFEWIKNFIAELQNRNDYNIIILSNKSDWEAEREISGLEIQQFISEFIFIKTFELSLLNKSEYNDFLNFFKEQIKISNDEHEWTEIKLLDPINISLSDILTQNVDSSQTWKLWMLGDSGVGKTSFIQKFYDNCFLENTTITLGIDVVKTVFQYSDTTMKLEIWDTAGQERMRALSKQYYNKGDAFILCFDVSCQSTFNSVKDWISEIKANSMSGEESIIFLVGNKIDCVESRCVSYDEVNKLCNENNFKYCEVSSKSGWNIYEVVSSVIFETYKQVKGITESFILKNAWNSKYSKKCCC